MNRGNLVLFDFDGTITRRDSFLLFIRYACGEIRFVTGCVAHLPAIVGYLCNRYPNDRLKEDFLRYFFAGWQPGRLEQLATAFTRERLPAILRPAALECIGQHRRAGDRIVLVSATPAVILRPWCREQGMDLVATELEISDARLTGRISGKNCWGEEKVRRIRSRYVIADYGAVYAYGDSQGDIPMLHLADHPFYRPFR